MADELLERDHELALLGAAIDEPGGRLVVVAGLAGAGKTRLLGEVTGLARRGQLRVVSAVSGPAAHGGKPALPQGQQRHPRRHHRHDRGLSPHGRGLRGPPLPAAGGQGPRRQRAILGAGPATWADLPSLPLAESVIQETLRLYPPAWFLSRKLTADTELGGRRLTAGSTLVFSAYAIHRGFPDAETFAPGRWQSPVDRRSYVPFGAGARRCIGTSSPPPRRHW
jgi:cytochrome P450